ncbi:MAG TPA: MogA/MoaB family molybdenum cofactor biosynthesis protein [Intrasporangium sp.]|uniref:MogA/MoaB family molybdenum cofactor biosynthesis protein n=1 Tax=Intrasporangium sp. TaxID=1925024 RepID=UPI002D78E81F|nr:MogA/MoaB family molybdenum cofactor biosynthesis protein [Intrasporangium sp.]HET7397820.1 MogA/MoaB family molybdenum cofactor biosynthesis protein [Intrasporangium sp.]
MSEAPGRVGAGRRAVALTASTRAAAGVYPDRSGPVVVARLRAWGFEVGAPVVVPDGEELGMALREVLASEPDLVVTTGGTGLTPTDRTPEMTAPLLDVVVPGVSEAFRAAGVAKGVPTAMLSRGLAGISGRTFVVNLPGSRGGVVDALDVLGPVLGHVLAQIPGGDH